MPNMRPSSIFAPDFSAVAMGQVSVRWILWSRRKYTTMPSSKSLVRAVRPDRHRDTRTDQR